ncbi:hypothetical protein [Palaeococcus ferrophilus]|uniref:hypothetical protein n=1 Tax=Palaeococcus ferrophilus TaxID=83868 RepID=UPI00064F8324|nr:hypothetical protein [Palaeococcus ferrophilus]
MRVVSVFELRGLPLEEAMKKLREAEWVLDEDCLLYPADLYREFIPASNWRNLPKREKTASHPKNSPIKHHVVRA